MRWPTTIRVNLSKEFRKQTATARSEMAEP